MDYSKEELLLPQTMIIEEDITFMDVKKLEDIMYQKSGSTIMIIFRNITGGNFSNAYRMGEILANSEDKVSILCEGSINLTGIIPLIAANSILCAAKENTNFVIDTKEYFNNYVEKGDQQNAKDFLRDIFFKSTNLHAIELSFILNTRTIVDVETAYKYNFINDIYRLKSVQDIPSSDFMKRFQNEAELTFDRCERDLLNEDQRSFIPFSNN